VVGASDSGICDWILELSVVVPIVVGSIDKEAATFGNVGLEAGDFDG